MSDDDQQTGTNFYSRLPTTRDFSRFADVRTHTPLPDNWIVIVTDIEASRSAINSGRYKTVNLVGASPIAAFKNQLKDEEFPFVFGGDGASLAIPGHHLESASRILSLLRRWASETFDLNLRAGLMFVADLRQSGCEVRTARYAASSSVSYAAFSGGGVRRLEDLVKSGDVSVHLSEPKARPDLTGLSCRWSNLKSRRGRIVSLVIEPATDVSDRQFLQITQSLLSRIDESGNNNRVISEEGPQVQYPPPGMSIEARATGGSFWLLRYLALSAQNLLAWILFRTGWSLESFDPRHYARQTGFNTDSRKYEDGLKMTIDCDAETLEWMKQHLEAAKDQGLINYGLTEQSEAFLTCIVISALNDDHVHFVDGANGGYAAAATMMIGNRTP